MARLTENSCRRQLFLAAKCEAHAITKTWPYCWWKKNDFRLASKYQSKNRRSYQVCSVAIQHRWLVGFLPSAVVCSDSFYTLEIRRVLVWLYRRRWAVSNFQFFSGYERMLILLNHNGMQYCCVLSCSCPYSIPTQMIDNLIMRGHCCPSKPAVAKCRVRLKGCWKETIRNKHRAHRQLVLWEADFFNASSWAVSNILAAV